MQTQRCRFRCRVAELLQGCRRCKGAGFRDAEVQRGAGAKVLSRYGGANQVQEVQMQR